MPVHSTPSPTASPTSQRSRRSTGMLGDAWAALTALVVAALVLTTAPASAENTPAATAAAHDPVIMIPGMTGNVSAMDPMRRNLESNGWPSNILFTWTDSSKMTQDLAAAARELSAKVDQVRSQTGASKVVLATWSASTLAARYYIKNLGGDAKVSQYVAFAGPQHGTTFNFCQMYVSCQQFGNANSAFLRALNSGTEVPGHPQVSYLTLRSTGDWNVAPTDSAKLAGADENYLMSGPMAPTHFNIISNATALAKMRSFILQHEPAASRAAA